MLLALAAWLLLGWPFGRLAAQEYVINGGFENGLTGWTAVGAHQGSGTGGHNSTRFGALPSGVFTTGTLSQTTTSLPAGRYVFSFWYRTFGNAFNVDLTASIGGTQVFRTVTNANSYAQFSQMMSLSGVTQLEFSATSTGSSAYIDDISLLYLSLMSQLSTEQPTNAANVASAIDATTGTLPSGFNALYNLSGEDLTQALGQLAGEPGPAVIQTGLDAANQFVNTVFDNGFIDTPTEATGRSEPALGYASERNVAREAVLAYAAVTPRDRAADFDRRWQVWAAAYGGRTRVSGDAATGTHDTTSRLYGVAAGATQRGPATQVGFALGGAGSNFDISDGFGSGKADVFNAAVYAKHMEGPAYLAGVAAYTLLDASTDRTVTVSGTDVLHASFRPQALTGRLEAGRRFALSAFGVTPYAAVQSTTFFLPAHGETATSGSDQFALDYGSRTVTATRGEVGAQFDDKVPLAEGALTLRAKAAWVHDWNADRSVTAVFQQLPGATFTVYGATPAADAALVSVGPELSLHNGWRLAARFDGEFSRTTTSYAGKGSLRYLW